MATFQHNNNNNNNDNVINIIYIYIFLFFLLLFSSSLLLMINFNCEITFKPSPPALTRGHHQTQGSSSLQRGGEVQDGEIHQVG